MRRAHRARRRALRHPAAGERRLQPSGDLLCALPRPGFVWEPAEGKDREIALGHDIDAEPGAPDLDQRRILPTSWFRSGHARMNREQRGPRHAVLQAGPRGTPQRATAVRQPRLERLRLSPKGENLRTGEFQSDSHVRPWLTEVGFLETFKPCAVRFAGSQGRCLRCVQIDRAFCPGLISQRLALEPRAITSGVDSKRWLGRPSAVEYRPAEVVSQPLIVQDKIANRLR